MGGVKKAVRITGRRGQPFLEAAGVAKPYLPATSGGFDRYPARVWLAGLDILAAQATRSECSLRHHTMTMPPLTCRVWPVT